MEGGRRGKQNIETDFKEEIVIDVEEEEICQLKDEWTTDSNDVVTTEESQTDEDYERRLQRKVTAIFWLLGAACFFLLFYLGWVTFRCVTYYIQ